jgi:ribonuclease P protein component
LLKKQLFVRGEVSDPTSEGMKQFSLTKNERLHKRHEFDAIFRNGEKYPTEHFLVIIHPNHYERRRLGIVVSKKIGKAVERNRIKRLVREFFRLNKSQFPDSCDLLFVVKRRLEKANYAAVYDELKAMFESHPFKKMQQNL